MAPAAGGASLAAVLDALLPGTVTVLAAPRGLDVPVREPVLGGPDDLGGAGADDILLAVGAGARDVAAVLERAGKAEATAVVVALSDAPPAGAIEAATAAGVALIGVPTDVSWGRLYTLLCSAGAGGVAGGAGVPAGDLFRLADAICAMVGAPVTIEDPRGVVLAYSSGSELVDEPRRQAILGRGVPERWVRHLRDSGIWSRLAVPDEVVRLAGTDELRPRVVIGVHAGGELLGSIWAAETGSPLGDDADQALRNAAKLAALHLVRRREVDDLERRRRVGSVLGVLDGRVPPETAATALGLAADGPVTVLAFELQGVDGADAAVMVERLADAVALHVQGASTPAACAAVGRTVYALLPGEGSAATDRDRARVLVPQVLDRARAGLHLVALAGVGRRVPGLAEVPLSRWDADHVLRVVAARDRERWALVEEVRAQVVLSRLGELAVQEPRLREGPLQGLVEQDQSKQTSYVETLRAYLDAFGDVAAAAARLNVHPNTFRYRLRRLEEVSGLDLSDPDDRLVAELQLRFL